ncbi:MAG TPA: metallophosphoesterase [Flavisolibacter sp.]
MADLQNERPDLLLVPGDITKDGEQVSHRAVATYLEQLRSQGTKVFVIPGNHDLNNAKAAQFNGDGYVPLPRTQPADFVRIYQNFGYSRTDRDPASLSYLAKPYDDLWILAIDANKYEEYGPEGDVAAGRIKEATMSWLLQKLAEAKAANVTVFAMMHHNLVEHYTNQSVLDPGYVIDDWQAKVHALMDAGLKIIFTGHYHANDITTYTHGGKSITDIQTGSLVTAPMPYRLITMKNKKLDVETRHVTSLPVAMPGGVSFTQYSGQFLSGHLDNYFCQFLQNAFGAPEPVASFAAPIYRNAIIAHFAGDEAMPSADREQINTLAGLVPQLADIATILWTDLGVKDNTVTVRFE